MVTCDWYSRSYLCGTVCPLLEHICRQYGHCFKWIDFMEANPLAVLGLCLLGEQFAFSFLLLPYNF